MDRPDDPSPSWLADLRAGRPTGWDRLHHVFAPVVGCWCVRTFRLRPADAEDVTQQVFLRVKGGIDGFRPGNFVGWLYRITQNAVRDHVRHRPAGVGGTDFLERLAREPAPEDDSAAPEAARLVAVRRVMDVVRGDVEERTWQAFWRTVVEGQETNDVAAALGMTPGYVRVVRLRVLARLREELGAES